MEPMHVVALSGGADSSAMALRLRELERQERGDATTRYTFVCTPTGNELPDMEEHWAKLGDMLGAPIVRLSGHTLEGLMERMRVLPTTRMRWCTRMLKVEPIIAWYARLPEGSVAYVGLRADEETREGIYGSAVRQAFPLREWGWTRADVEAYLKVRGVRVPGRTDCAWCPYQGADDWYRLWRDHPDTYARAEGWEREIGHTFRSPTAKLGTWAASLADMRAQFEAGKLTREERKRRQLSVLGHDDEDAAPCRVCRI